MVYPKEFKRLYTFKIVYECHSFTQASQILFITQASVSGHIAQLEEDLEVSLFHRKGRHTIEATEEARVLYEQLGTLFDHWNDTLHLINKVSTSKLHCTIAASNSFSIAYLPKLVMHLTEQHPNIEFTFLEQNSETIHSEIMRKDIDLGFVERPFAPSEKIKSLDLIDDALVLAGNPKSATWLFREDHSGIQHYTQKYLEKYALKPEHIIHVNNNNLMLRLLKEGNSQCLLSISNLKGTNIPYTKLETTFERKISLLIPQPASSVYLEIKESLETWFATIV